MPIYALPDLLAASIAFGIGFFESIGWMASKPRARDIAFVALCTACAVYAAGCAGQYSVASAAETVFWLRLQYAALAVASFSLVALFRAETGLVSRRVLGTVAVFACAFSLVQIGGFGSFTWSADRNAMHEVALPLVGAWFYPEASPGIASTMQEAFSIALSPYLMLIAIRFRRKDAKRGGRLLFVPAILFVAYINDMAVSYELFTTPYLLQYSFLAVVVYEGLERATRERESATQLRSLAYFDILTGLPNRTHFHENLNAAIDRTRRFGRTMAVLFLDLDRFKNVNDTKGHDAGDALLVEVSRRIKARVRASDSVARLGGDEFTVILEGLERKENAALVSQSLIDSLALPYRLDGLDFYMGVSIGIALFPADVGPGEGAEVGLLRMADAAMYRAKKAGGNAYRYFSSETDSRNKMRVEREGQLRRALEGDEFRLLFQPLVSLGTGRVRGAEALIRWLPPGSPMIMPGDFIGLAEETGLIKPIGNWVLRTACEEAAKWVRRGFNIPVSVNVSAMQINDDLPDLVRQALSQGDLPAANLILEITESAIMRDLANSKRIMSDIRSMGVRVAIDDFGTGYSSLGYLANFPVSELKIDQSFVRELASQDRMRSIVKAIIAMARGLGLETVAEGIETDDQRRFLSDKGCDTGQGYLYARPVEPDRLLELAAVGYPPPDARGSGKESWPPADA